MNKQFLTAAAAYATSELRYNGVSGGMLFL